MSTITKLYDLLCNKLGKETAENLTTFIDNKIDHGLTSHTHSLATKEDMAKIAIAQGALATKEDLAKVAIAQGALATKEDLAKVALATKEDLARHAQETKDEIAKLAVAQAAFATKEEMGKLKEEIAQFSFSIKEDFAKLSLDTKQDIINLREAVAKLDGKVEARISASKAETIKWMFIFWIGQIMATLIFLKR